jgi:hypothetical protein
LRIIHLLKDNVYPIFEFLVVFAFQEYIPNSIEFIFPHFMIIHIEISNIETAHALNKILLNASTGGDYSIDHLMLAQIFNDFAHARGNAVAGVAQENGAPLALLAAPLDHVVELINGQTQVGRLNTHRLVARKYLGVVHALVEIVTLHHIVRYCQVRFVVS